MKFGRQLVNGLYGPWQEHYMSYDKFKRICSRFSFVRDQRQKGRTKYEIKKAKSEFEATERTPLNSGGSTPPPVGDGQYMLSIQEPGVETRLLSIPEPSRAQRSDSIMAHEQMTELDSKKAAEEFFAAVDEELHKVEAFYCGKEAELQQELMTFEARHTMQNNWSVPAGNTFRRIKALYVELLALVQYVALNSDGFRKIVKKFDKVGETKHLPGFMEKLEKYKFYHNKTPEQLVKRCQCLVSRDKLLEMQQLAEAMGRGEADTDQERLFPSVKPVQLVFSIVVCLLVRYIRPLGPGHEHPGRCLTILALATSLWITEAIPYFVTALMIPILVVMMGVLPVEGESPHATMPVQKAANAVLGQMVNHTTILIMGGYSISAAFSRCEIELRIASLLQQWLGNKPRFFILSIMYLGLFLSMLISNHTAPVLCVSILLPIVRDTGSGSRFSKTLLIGLAFACNFGGMVTPIASMQNVVCSETLERYGYRVSFGMWIAAALPFTILGVLVAWALLMLIMDPSDVKQIPLIVYTKDKIFTRTNIMIICLSLLTIIGWSTISETEDIFGDLGIIALMFMVVIFGSGILSEVDFNSFSWHTLFLLGGGSVLGKAIEESQLLAVIAQAFVQGLPQDNKWLLVVEVGAVTLFISTFVSHTVAAIVLMPIIITVGDEMGVPVTLGVTACFAVSAGCALPFSSFPNITTLQCKDDYNNNFLRVPDFLRCGVPLSLLTLAMISTIGIALISVCILPKVNELEAAYWGFL